MAKEEKALTADQIDANNAEIISKIKEIESEGAAMIAELRKGFVKVEHNQASLQYCNAMSKKANATKAVEDKPKQAKKG
jgi:hypothetical protein